MSTSPTSVAAKELRPDYPSFLPPMLVKELRQVMRTKGFIAVFLGIHVIMLLVLVLALLTRDVQTADYFSVLNGLFWGLLTVVLLIITPMRGAATLNTELENKSIDLLLLTQLSARRIVLGKWGSLLGTGLLFATSLLPYGILRYFFGPVDFLEDLLAVLALVLGGATLTALSVWSSGQNKVVRILIPILAVISLQTSTVGFFVSRSIRTGGVPMNSSGFPSLLSMDFFYMSLCALVLLVFFLLHGARRITPPAVNDAIPIRLLPLLGIITAIILSLSMRPQVPMFFALIFFVLVIGIEVAQSRELMPVHWRYWMKRGPLLRSAGLMLLPGWLSASLYAAVVLTLCAALGCFDKFRPSGPKVDYATFTWWLALAWQALVFPAALLAMLPASARKWGGAGLYFIIQGLLGILAIFATNVNVVLYPNLKSSLLLLGNILPGSSFWLTSSTMAQMAIATHFLIGQVIMMMGTVLLLWAQAKPAASMIRKLNRELGPTPDPLKLERKR